MATVGMLLLAACAAPVTEDAGTLEPLHGQITPEMLVAPAARSNLDEIAALEATQGIWRSEGVIDGQTLVLVSEGDSVRIRLAGVAVPVGDECRADLARDSLRFIVGGQKPLSLDADLVDRTADVRPGYVETIDGEDISAAMLRLGLAEIDEATLDPDRADQYRAELESAQAEPAGIWAPDSCEPVAEG